MHDDESFPNPLAVLLPLNDGERSRSGRFTAGNPGGPGRPPGARNRTTLAAAALLHGEAEQLARTAIAKALDGDAMALRLCLDRIVPVVRDRSVAFDMPPLETAADAVGAMAAIAGAVADGALTPGEASDVSRLVTEFVRAFLAHDLEARVRRLERERIANCE